MRQIKETYQHYYGDLHSHTGFSDGRGTPLEALEWGKKSQKGDFLAISDHAGSITAQKWEATVAAVQAVSDEAFCGFASYESGYSDEYIDEDGVPVVNGGELNVLGAKKLLVEAGYPEGYEDFCNLLAKEPQAIAFFNHPQEASWPTDKIWNAYNEYALGYPHMKEQLVGMEVSNETSAYNKIHERAYTIGLDQGWRFAPFATTDTHGGEWLSGFNDRTVVLATELTEDALLEAMRQRRIYAVENPNFKAEFYVNGQIMGSVLEGDETQYHLDIELIHQKPSDQEAFRLVEVISDYGTVLARKECNSYEVHWELTVESHTARYFFVRVVNEAQQRIWTAPVWTGRRADVQMQEKKGQRIPYEAMKVVSCSSEHPEHLATEVICADTKTWWESNGQSGEFVIDLGGVRNLMGVGYRKNYIEYVDRVALSKLLDCYTYEVLEDLEGKAVASVSGRVLNYGHEHYQNLGGIKGRYIRIKALCSVEQAHVAIGNIYIYEGNTPE